MSIWKPITLLLKIGKLHVLKDFNSEIYIPKEVYNEIESGNNKEYYSDLSKIDWVKILSLENKKSLFYFFVLNNKEAEAIVLAIEIETDFIILDETLGRFHAKHAGLKVTGTLGILLKAKQLGFVSELKSLLLELRIKGIWLSDRLIEEMLRLSNEKQ